MISYSDTTFETDGRTDRETENCALCSFACGRAINNDHRTIVAARYELDVHSALSSDVVMCYPCYTIMYAMIHTVKSIQHFGLRLGYF